MEPASNTGVAVATATGAITLTGAMFGLQYDALLFGLFGGLVSLMHLPQMSTFRMGASLVVSAAMGAMFAPIGYAGALNYADWLAKVPPDVVRLGLSCLVGLTAQVLIPAGLNLIRRKGETV